MTATDDGITRRESMEIGIDAPNPEQEWEAEPVLLKRIIKKRLRDKLIAEKKWLLYVAATRAMDHLVLVGHSKFSSPAVVSRVRFAPLDQLTNWMDWINRILGLSFLGDGWQGEIPYGNAAGTAMRIPYRWFMAQGAPRGADAEYRTEFPLEDFGGWQHGYRMGRENRLNKEANREETIVFSIEHNVFFHLVSAIESAIARVYKRNPGLKDKTVITVLERLIGKPAVHLGDELSTTIQTNMRLILSAEPYSRKEVIGCLKKVQRSVKLHHSVDGPTGYLDFIKDQI